MKILVGGFHQETNSFSSRYSISDFFNIVQGDALLAKHPGTTNSQLSGIVSVAKAAGATVIPSIFYVASSGGPVYKEVVDEFLKVLLADYDANAPIDGIFMDLHGATSMVGGIDGCGYILEAIRNHVGNDVVIAHGSDMHANITSKMLQYADGIAGYHTYPHVDYFETGRRAAMHGMMKLQGKPFVQARVRVPMIVPAEGYNTNEGVFADFIKETEELIKSGKIIDFSIYQMQPWLDMADAASTVLVTAETKETAAAYAQELAHRLFDLRKQITVDLYSVDEIIDIAKANETDMPVILVDSADSPGAGSSADSSFVLSRLLERGETLKTCLFMSDAPAAEHAFEVGVGNEGDFSLGGTCEPGFQKPLKVHAYVKCLHDGVYPNISAMMARKGGKSAVLQIGNIDVVVCTKLPDGSDPQSYRTFGIEPAHYRLAMAKSATQYKVHFGKFTSLFYPADTPGSSSANLAAMPFEKLPRPFYPLDDIDTFDDTVTFHA